MALSLNTVHEVKFGGSDTLNGGMFDPGQTAGMFTDGAATIATTGSPVFTSASYNFIAGDVGAYIFVGAGTNWAFGWYKIASVAANAATLDAAIGKGVTYTATNKFNLSTVIGCASTASPTGATWSIDYSQQAALQFAYTDLASVGSGLLVSSAAKPFGKQQVGNSLVITGGTNFNTGRYVIASVSVGFVATVVGPTNITSAAGVSGTGSQGGAFATVGLAMSLVTVAGMRCFFQYNASDYTLTTATPGAGGPIASTVGCTLQGYDVTRGDDTGNRPTLNWGAVAAPGALTYMYTTANVGMHSINNVRFDGNSVNNVGGIILSLGNTEGFNCVVTNCDGTAGVGGAITNVAGFVKCLFDGNTLNISIATNNGAYLRYCTSKNSVGNGVTASQACVVENSIFDHNGADGGSFAQGTRISNSTFSDNVGDGIDSSTNRINVTDTVLSYNGGYGINGTTTLVQRLINVASIGNTSGRWNSAPIVDWHPVILTVDPFVSKATGDYRPNATAGGGALLRGLGIGVYGQTNNTDIGAVQHTDPSSSGATQLVGGGLVN